MGNISILNFGKLGDFAPMFAGAFDDMPEGEAILLGYTQEDMACAALAAIQVEEVVLLRWVMVEESCRRQGIGRQLIKALCQYAAANGIREVDAVVCLPKKEQAVAKALLLSGGFQLTEQNSIFSLPLSTVLEGPLAVRIKKAPHSGVVSFAEVSNFQIKEFNFNVLRQEGLPPVQISQLLTDCSFAWLEKEKITGCILLASCGEDVEIRWLYGQKPLAVQEMISAAAAALAERYDSAIHIYAASMQPSVESLIRKISGGRLREEQTVDFYQCLF